MEHLLGWRELDVLASPRELEGGLRDASLVERFRVRVYALGGVGP